MCSLRSRNSYRRKLCADKDYILWENVGSAVAMASQRLCLRCLLTCLGHAGDHDLPEVSYTARNTMCISSRYDMFLLTIHIKYS